MALLGALFESIMSALAAADCMFDGRFASVPCHVGSGTGLSFRHHTVLVGVCLAFPSFCVMLTHIYQHTSLFLVLRFLPFLGALCLSALALGLGSLHRTVLLSCVRWIFASVFPPFRVILGP